MRRRALLTVASARLPVDAGGGLPASEAPTRDGKIPLVEHDVAAIMATSDRVVVLDHGRLLAAGSPTTVVLVEQDAHAAFAVAGRGSLLDRGAVAAAGPTDRLRRDPGVQAAYLGTPPTR